jgi:hypothetical protein
MANRYKQFTTPRGVFIYPHLSEPDTKFVKPDGEYHTKFALNVDDTATNAFIDQLEAELTAYRDAQIEEAANPKKAAALKKANVADVFEEELDDEGNTTGRLIFKFKLKAKVETKNKSWDQAPRLFDGQAKPINGDVSIWTGSEGNVNVEVFPYYMESTKQFGLSLRCIAAQVLKLVSGGGASADDYGFGAEDDAYVAEGSGFTPDTGSDDTDDGEDDGEF